MKINELCMYACKSMKTTTKRSSSIERQNFDGHARDLSDCMHSSLHLKLLEHIQEHANLINVLKESSWGIWQGLEIFPFSILSISIFLLGLA